MSNAPWFAALFILLVIGNGILGMALKGKDTKMTFKIFEGIDFPNMIALYLTDSVLNKYQMGKDIKVNRLGSCVDSIAGDCFEQMMPVFDRLTLSQAKYQSLGGVAANAASAVIYIFVAIKAALGSFPVGGVVQYVGGITRFNAGFTGLAANSAALFSNTEALELYFEFLDKPDKVYHGTIPVEKRSDNEYEIEFHNVSFRYPGTETYALKNLNLKLNVGQRMAVVGMNGSGKTTMIKLLCHLYDPTDGEITLNGIDIKKYDYKE